MISGAMKVHDERSSRDSSDKEHEVDNAVENEVKYSAPTETAISNTVDVPIKRTRLILNDQFNPPGCCEDLFADHEKVRKTEGELLDRIKVRSVELEKDIKELTERNTAFEARIQRLETEKDSEKLRRNELEQENRQLGTQLETVKVQMTDTIKKMEEEKDQAASQHHIQLEEAKKMKFCAACDEKRPLVKYFCGNDCVDRYYR